MPNFVDLFDGASLDARWAGSAATFDAVNDRVDLSAGSLVAVTGTLDSDDFSDFDFEFEITPYTDYQNFEIVFPKTNSNPRCKFTINTGEAGGGSRASCTFRVSFVSASFGSFGGAIGPAVATATFIDGLNTFRATRSATGAWELFLNAVSVGTGQEPAGTTTYYDTPSNLTGEISFGSADYYLNSVTVAAAGAANTDPVLDTPQPDISVATNASGTIADISGNFSDADLDTLTYSVTPVLPTGMTLNTTTGVISGDGSITATAAANYTFTADDGNGGTVDDIVSIEVTGVANPGLRLTLRDAENSNAIIASETGLTVHVYDTDGGTELLTTTAETTDGSGVLEIDSDAIGAVAATAFIVAKRSNGQTCCGTVTVIDLDA